MFVGEMADHGYVAVHVFLGVLYRKRVCALECSCWELLFSTIFPAFSMAPPCSPRPPPSASVNVARPQWEDVLGTYHAQSPGTEPGHTRMKNRTKKRLKTTLCFLLPSPAPTFSPLFLVGLQRRRKASQIDGYPQAEEHPDPQVLRQSPVLCLLLHRGRAVLRAAVPAALRLGGEPCLRPVAHGEGDHQRGPPPQLFVSGATHTLLCSNSKPPWGNIRVLDSGHPCLLLFFAGCAALISSSSCSAIATFQWFQSEHAAVT